MLRIPTLIVALLLTASFANAQPGEPPFDKRLVTVKNVDAGTLVSVGWTDENGNQAYQHRADTNNNGEVDFAIPQGVTEITVSKHSDGEYLQYTVKLKRLNVSVSSGTIISN